MNNLIYLISSFNNFCSERGVIIALRFVGFLIFAIKVLVPIIIILLGSFDLAKAITSSDDSKINETTVTLIKRIVLGIFIFFIPTILTIVLGLNINFKDIENNYKKCMSCMLKPGTCEIPSVPTGPNQIGNDDGGNNNNEDDNVKPINNQQDLLANLLLPIPKCTTTSSTGKFGACRSQNGNSCGRKHMGIDMTHYTDGGSVKKSTPVYAIADGVVILADNSISGLGGRTIEIKHDFKVNSRYVHLSKLSVKKDYKVKKGQTIGYVGGSGKGSEKAYVPHLHFGLKINGTYVNPSTYYKNQCSKI